MALFRRFFYQKPPDRLLEISERIYVFDCCFSTNVLDESEYKPYMDHIVAQLQGYYPESSFMVFNFREGDKRTQISDILSHYDVTVSEYPRQYENCPLLPMEMIHHFLRSSDSWLSLEGQKNVLLMHCERGGWPVLAFMLAGLLLYRKQYNWEQKTLEMIYKQAPKELLRLLSPLNPQPSQLRYLQYISGRNMGLDWPPLDTPLVLDSLILKVLPMMDGGKCCRPVVRVYGQDPLNKRNRGPKLLFSSLKDRRRARNYPEMELVKLVIGCGVQGDVVLECVHLRNDSIREEMMFRVMFHTAFVRSHNITFTRDEVDLLWDKKDKFPKDFKAEVLFSDVGAVPYAINMDLESSDENDVDAAFAEQFYEVEEMFKNTVDGTNGKGDSDPPVFQDCPSDELRQKHEALVGLNPIALKKEVSFDNGKQKPESKPEYIIKVVKEINLGEGDGKSVVQVEADMSSVNDIVDACREESIVVEGAEEKQDGDIEKRSPRSLTIDVVRHKADKLLQYVTKRPQTANQKSAPDPQADAAAKLTKQKTAERKWIPTNKGSLNNSKHVTKRPIVPSISACNAKLPIGTEASSQPPPPPPPPQLPRGSSAPQPPPPPLPPPGGRTQLSTPQPPPPPPPVGRGPPTPPPPIKGGVPSPPAPPRAPGGGPPAPPPGEPKGGMGARGRLTRSAAITTATAPRKQLLKPLHWSKVTRITKGTLWDELQGRTQIEGEINLSEIESLFSTIAAKPAGKSTKNIAAPKSEVIHLEVKGLKNEGSAPKRKRGRPFGSLSACKRKVNETGEAPTALGISARRSTRERK